MNFKKFLKKCLRIVDLVFYSAQIPLTFELAKNLAILNAIFWLKNIVEYNISLTHLQIDYLTLVPGLTFFMLQYTYFANFLVPKIKQFWKDIKRRDSP